MNGIWQENDQYELELAVLEYDPVPGTLDTYIDFTSDTGNIITMNARGQIAFHLSLTDESHAVGAKGRGIFAQDLEGNLQLGSKSMSMTALRSTSARSSHFRFLSLKASVTQVLETKMVVAVRSMTTDS